MNRRALIPGILLTVAVAVMFTAVALSFGEYNVNDPQEQPFAPDDGVLPENSINYVLFEEYGPILLVVALLMFGAILGGVYIAREDDEDDSD